MVAASYSKARSELAKALGLGQKAAGRKRKAKKG
jgi:predicted transcriptional regulator